MAQCYVGGGSENRMKALAQWLKWRSSSGLQDFWVIGYPTEYHYVPSLGDLSSDSNDSASFPDSNSCLKKKQMGTNEV